MLLLKLLLVPAFLLLISLAGKRWGAGVAGWLAGFPVVAGPILLFITWDSGAAFAARAATTSLAATFGLVTFGSTYARCSRRWSWQTSLSIAMLAWFVVAELVARAATSLWAACGFAGLALAIAPLAFPRIHAPPHTTSLPKIELIYRMMAGAALTLCVTLLADRIGPAWSGLLSVFPIMGIVLAVFSHRANGPEFASALLRGMSTGLWSFVLFCFALAVALERTSAMAAFAIALVVALIAHGVVRMNVSRGRASHEA